MSYFFFFNDTATTEIYTLSLHDALPISQDSCRRRGRCEARRCRATATCSSSQDGKCRSRGRSEEHTSELQSPCNLVCRLLLEKKKDDTPQGRTSTDVESGSITSGYPSIC